MGLAKITEMNTTPLAPLLKGGGGNMETALCGDLTNEQYADMVVQEMQMFISYSQDLEKHKLRCDFKCDAREEEFLCIRNKHIFIEAEMSYKLGRDKYNDDYELIKGELLNRISHKLKQGFVKKVIVRALEGKFI